MVVLLLIIYVKRKIVTMISVKIESSTGLCLWTMLGENPCVLQNTRMRIDNIILRSLLFVRDFSMEKKNRSNIYKGYHSSNK